MADTENEYMKYKLSSQPHCDEEAKLGHGGYGVVYKANVQRPGIFKPELCAVKKISKHNHNLPLSGYQRELGIFVKLLQHEWFVQFFGWHDSKDYIYIAMEYMELGDLQQHVAFKWTEEDTKVVASQLLEGLMIMHKNGIVHRDLKPANVFPSILDQRTLRIKIGDFGISKRVSNDSSRTTTYSGTPDYMAPEVIEQKPYDKPVDLWALGCIIYRMVTGKLPFGPGQVFAYKYGAVGFPQKELEEMDISKTGIEFLRNMMQAEPEKRMTVEVALNSGWIHSKPPAYLITEQLGHYFVNSRGQWEGQGEASKTIVPSNRIPGRVLTNTEQQLQGKTIVPSNRNPRQDFTDTQKSSQGNTIVPLNPFPEATAAIRLSQQHIRPKAKLLGHRIIG